MKFSRRPLGFSLIELLVVLMVISLVMSLIGPSINKVYSQHMAQQEMRLLRQYVRDAAVFAFANHETLKLAVFDSRLEVMSTKPITDATDITQNTESLKNTEFDIDNSELADQALDNVILERQFDYLVFEPADFEALKSGQITLNVIQVSVGSAGISKNVAVRGVAFTEQWQG